jgi:hypothetical protein
MRPQLLVAMGGERMGIERKEFRANPARDLSCELDGIGQLTNLRTLFGSKRLADLDHGLAFPRRFEVGAKNGTDHSK